MWLPVCVESLILTNLSSTVDAWFLAFKYPEWESQLCHKENNWIGNVFSPGSRARGICEGGKVKSFSPCVLQSCSATVDSPRFSQQNPGDGSSLCHWDKCDPTGCETLEHVCHPQAAPAGAGAALYTRGRLWGGSSRCCCSHAVLTIYFHPQAASREGLVAARLLPFVRPPRLIPSPAVLVANLCCKPSLHISAKLAQKDTFTWQ